MITLLLAAGRSTRLSPVADKNTLKFLGTPLIKHQVDRLIRNGFEKIIIVVNRENKKKIQDLALPVGIIEQKDLTLGIKGAILACAAKIRNEELVIINTNDVVEERVYQNLGEKINNNKKMDGFLVAKKVTEYFPGGYLTINRPKIIQSIIEKPSPGKEFGNLVNLLIHYHRSPRTLIEYLKQTSSPNDDQYELALAQLFQEKKYQALVYKGDWQTIKYPWHVLETMNYFLNHNSGKIHPQSFISDKASISGPVWIEEGARIFDFSSIIGPCYIGKNTTIANNCLIRQSMINDRCVIGYGTEIARSYLDDEVWTHHNYLGDSIVGQKTVLGAGSITGNLRFDQQKITVKIKQDPIVSSFNKLGAIIGENVKIGINVSILPGKKIGQNCIISPGCLIHKDIPPFTSVTQAAELKLSSNK